MARRSRADGRRSSGLIDEPYAFHDAGFDDEIGDEGVILRRDGTERARPLPEDTSDLPAGRIARVQHAPHAVRRLAAECRFPGGIAIERAPVEQLADVARPFGDQHVDRLGNEEAVAGSHRVARVKLG